MRMLTSSLLLIVTATASAAGEPVTLERLLGPQAYREMGIGKLTPEEQERLLRWVLAREGTRSVPMSAPSVKFGVTVDQAVPVEPTPAPAPAPASMPPVEADLFGIEQTDGPKPQEFRARLVGEFTGWTGKTEFVLDNGQVWRQSTSGTYRHREMAPEVIIERAAVGYKLRLVSTRRSINVRRVK